MSTTFKSYVDVELEDSALDDADVESSTSLKPVLLPGEVVIAQASNVLKFTALSERKKGTTGGLFVTNYKVSFITADGASHRLIDQSQPNLLLGANDICLTNIESVAQGIEDSKKKKKLMPRTNVSSKIQILQIYCRDFRVHVFSFKFTPLGEDKNVVNAILHHAYPPRHQLLFAYEYKQKLIGVSDPFGPTKMFSKASDWEEELERLSCKQWRVSFVNDNFNMSRTHPDRYVVPAFLLDQNLTTASPAYQGNRLLVFSWGNSEGCVIARASQFIPNVNENHQKSFMIQALQKTHPTNQKPILIDLDFHAPKIRDIQQSYVKLRTLCTPDTLSQFWEQDTYFLSSLESSRWLEYVSYCLTVAKRVATAISTDKKSVILQEENGRDLTCLISSLAQIILDSHYRTVVGFQSLIQKEWIMMGHPFLYRLGRIYEKEDEESPVFLLFLDCVWQMLQQFHSAFEFTETYLTTLWDSVHISVFDTFLFNCEKERRDATRDYNNPFMLRSVWNWGYQFSREQTTRLFINPLYTLAQELLNGSSDNEFPNTEVPQVPIRNSNFAPARKHSDSPHRISWGGGNYSGYANNGENIKENHGNGPNNRRKGGKNRQGGVYKSVSLWSLRSISQSLPEMSAFAAKWPQYQVLPIQSDLPLLHIWAQCYLRWLPTTNLVGGGTPVEHMQQCLLVKEIRALRRNLVTLMHSHTFDTYSSGALGNDVFSTIDEANLTYPTAAQNKWDEEVLTSAYPFSPGGTTSVQGIPLSFYRKSSYISDDELDDI